MGGEKMKKAYFSRRLYKSKMDILPVTETSYAIRVIQLRKAFRFSNTDPGKAMGTKITSR
jgi:hypothetical protein